MQRRLTTQDLTWFLDLNGANRLNLDPSYQRKSVWTRADRQYFLDTIFNNYPSPAIFLHKELDDRGNATYHVIDGKQRLETILMFVADKISIRDDIGDTRLANKKWRDLADEPELRRQLWDYQFTVEMIDSIEAAVVNDIFGRLNKNSRKLMPQEIRHSRYDGWLITFAETEAERGVWKQLRVSTAGRARRMQDVQFISELMSVSILGRVAGFDHDALDEIYAAYDDPEQIEGGFDTDAFVENFTKNLSYLLEMEGTEAAVTTYASNFAHLYTLWSWLELADGLPPADDTAVAYASFMRAAAAVQAGAPVEDSLSGVKAEVLQYADNARGASTDAKQRTERQHALTSALASMLRV